MMLEPATDDGLPSAASPSAWVMPRQEEESGSSLLRPLHAARGLGHNVNPSLREGGQLLPRAQADHPDWLAFLDKLANPEVGLNPAHAKRVRQVWSELRGAVGAKLSLPLAERLDDGSLCLSWSTEASYAEIEVRADGKHTWFVRDHAGDRHDGSNGPETGSPSRRLLQFLQTALHEPR